MKICLAAIAALLAVALFSLANTAPAGVETSPCCSKYSNTAFPEIFVKDYFRTSSSCNLPSVVFIFNNGKQGCADPKAKWVKDLMEYLHKKNNPTS